MSKFALNGVPLMFPFQPYPSQMALMSRMILAMNKREHALLEAPTGSGKTMALLCASLAWQVMYKGQAQQHAKDDAQAAAAAAMQEEAIVPPHEEDDGTPWLL